MTTNLVPKGSDIFYCDICDYSTSRKSQYTRHTTTAKHITNTQILQNTTKTQTFLVIKLTLHPHLHGYHTKTYLLWTMLAIYIGC